MEKKDFLNTELPDIIELKNIVQRYDGADTPPVIQDFNLLIEDKKDVGQFVVLMGASGCGKSTVLRYICGLQKPTSGEILIKGKNISDNDRVPMVFQSYSSFPWKTVLENVAIGLEYQGVPKKERNERAMEMIQLVGLDGHENKYAKYPLLSGGQLQRVAIARNLVVNSEILILDEPFGALDVLTRVKMQEVLKKIWQTMKPTIILVTHAVDEAVFLGDDIYVMTAGPGHIVHHKQTGFLLRENDVKRTNEFRDTVDDLTETIVKIGEQAKTRLASQKQVRLALEIERKKKSMFYGWFGKKEIVTPEIPNVTPTQVTSTEKQVERPAEEVKKVRRL